MHNFMTNFTVLFPELHIIEKRRELLLHEVFQNYGIRSSVILHSVLHIVVYVEKY